VNAASTLLTGSASGHGIPQSQITSIFANGFVLDLLRIVRGPRDVLDGVILLCLAEANWTRRPGGALGPGTSDPLPSSIGALANSLGMPFETVRRRTTHLCEEGLCEHTARGLLIAENSAFSPLRPEALRAVADRLHDLYRDLRRCGAFTHLQAGHAAAAPNGDSERVLFHLASAYFLRMLETLRPHVRSILDGAVMLAVYEHNSAPLAAELLAPQPDAPVTWPGPDRLRRPARAADVATRLGLPYETIRRHAKMLVQSGALIQQRRGLVVPRSALVHPATQQAMTYSHATLVRTFETCARLGIIATWREPGASEREA
jgi:hypothetical protein